MKKWILTLMTAFFLMTVIVGIGATTKVSAATEKTGTTSDGFSYKILSEDGTVEITKYNGKKKKLVFPSEIEGRKVTRIGELVIMGNDNVVSVEVPDSVKKIEEEAFAQSEKLKTIKLGKNVEELGEDDWLYTTGKKLESIEVSSKNKTYYSIDGVLFKKGKNGSILAQYPYGKKDSVYQVPEGITEIRMGALSEKYLNTLIISKSVEKFVLTSNWCYCEEIIVDENNQNYYSKDGVLFDKNHWLMYYPLKKSDIHYDIPDGTIGVDTDAFIWNQYIEEVAMPDSVKWLADTAFAHCKNLKSVDTAAGMGEEVFCWCDNLENLNLREGVDYISEWAFGNSKVTDIVVPASVKALETNATTTSELKTLTILNKDCTIKGRQGAINKVIIYGYADSTAEAFAKEYGYQFKLIGEEEIPGEDLSQGTITKETIKLSRSSYTYDGKAKKPKVVVKDKFGKTIKKEYYKVTYKNNKNVGLATVKIQLIGAYTGTIKTTFSIKPPLSTITKAEKTENGFRVQWKGVKASQIDGYEIQYSTDKKFKKENRKRVFVNQSNAVKKTIKAGKKEKQYYVRIRSYKVVSKDGKTERLYSKWSEKKTVKNL